MEPSNPEYITGREHQSLNVAPLSQVIKRQELKTSKKWILLVIPAIAFTVILSSIYLLIYNDKKDENTRVNPINQIQPTPTTYTFKSTIQYLNGQVWKIVDDRKVELKEKDILQEGDTVTTDTKSRVVIVVDEGSVIRLDENSNITLTELRPERIIINKTKGISFYRVDSGDEHTFIVKAGDYELKSLGTAYSVENNDEVKVTVFEHSVEIDKGGEEKQTIKEKQQWTAVKNSVNTIELNKITKNEFYNWSLQEEKFITPTLTPTPKPTGITGILLSGKATEKGIALYWKAEGMNFDNGFKLIKNTSGNPRYPEDSAVFVAGDTRSYVWEITDGVTWHFRICQYLEGKCGVYSNEISVSAPSIKTENSKVTSLFLKVQKIGDNKAKAVWTVEGTSPSGFKIVWGKNANPTYPTREGDTFLYLSDSTARSAEITALESGSTYHFRVCEYLGGKCGIYSSDVIVNF